MNTFSAFLWNSDAAKSLENATNGTGRAIPLNHCRQVGWFIKYTGTVSGGTIIIEWAPEENYAETWQQLDSINAANLAAGTEGSGTFAGPIGFVRARISSAILGGGNITALINGLQN